MLQDLILFDFETESELDKIQWSCRTLLNTTAKHASHGARSMKLEMYPSDYPGLTYNIDGHDWRGYKEFQMDVFNPQIEEVRLSVRLDDKKNYSFDGDSYNQTFSIRPGQTIIHIPLVGLRTTRTERMIDLKDVHRIVLFSSNLTTRTTLYLDYLRLMRET